MFRTLKKLIFGNDTEHHEIVVSVPGKLGRARLITAMYDISGKLEKTCEYYGYNISTLEKDKYRVNLSITSDNNDEVLRKTKSMIQEWLRKNP